MRNHVYAMVAELLIAATSLPGCTDQKTDTSYPLANFSDGNWQNGIAKSWDTAFFVPLTPEARALFTVGATVTFGDGTARTILRTKDNDGSLIVFLDGPPLDGTAVGYPKTIKVSRTAK